MLRGRWASERPIDRQRDAWEEEILSFEFEDDVW
jgi:hypothetical protein